ncbi:MAG: Na+/H+ antiporter NhaC [Tissierellia bacterium]|nr:Na+/H+ antiporter NhaC [Tissierellia bacterium]
MKERRRLTLPLATIGFLAPLIVILIMLRFKLDIKLAMAAGITIECLYGIYLGCTWEELEESAMKGISKVSQTVIVMMLIGMLIGVWLTAGSVQTLLYYGINLIHPKLFLPLAFLICVITSLITGTSWGTAGTMGIALIGVAQGLGIPPEMAAGAIISGALVGDKLSPLSDTTLLTSAVTEVKLFDHIMSLCYVTIPVSIVATIIYTLLGWNIGGDTYSLTAIESLSAGLQQSSKIGLLMLVPLAFVLIASAMRKPSIPVFAMGVAIGIIWSVLIQGHSMQDVVNAAIKGFTSITGNESIDKLLSRGGLMSMSGTIFLCIGAGMLSGVFEETRVLATLVDHIRTIIKTAGSLVLSVTATCVAMMFGGAGQSCTLTLPAVAFREAFEEYNIHPAVLSRTLECSGTVLGSLVPWDASAILYTGLFGVSVGQYLPYNYLALFSPTFAVITAYIGYGMFTKDEPITMKKFFTLSKVSKNEVD